MLVIPARSGLPTPLIWAGAGGAALLAGLAAWRLRRARGRIIFLARYKVDNDTNMVQYDLKRDA